MTGENAKRKAPLDLEPTHRYNDAVQEHAEEGDPAAEADEAKHALESPEGHSLKEAEEEGRNAAAERDPQVHRDYSKGA